MVFEYLILYRRPWKGFSGLLCCVCVCVCVCVRARLKQGQAVSVTLLLIYRVPNVSK